MQIKTVWSWIWIWSTRNAFDFWCPSARLVSRVSCLARSKLQAKRNRDFFFTRMNLELESCSTVFSCCFSLIHLCSVFLFFTKFITCQCYLCTYFSMWPTIWIIFDTCHDENQKVPNIFVFFHVCIIKQINCIMYNDNDKTLTNSNYVLIIIPYVTWHIYIYTSFNYVYRYCIDFYR